MSLLPISDLGRSKLALAAAVTGASGSRSSNRGGGGGGRGDQPQGMLAKSTKPPAAYFNFYHAQMLLMHKVIQSLLQDQQ